MFQILKKSFFLLTILCTVLCVQSCKEEEGCTDPNGENYSADAAKDDGSCTYARTKFIGNYGAGESCNGGAATSLIGSIEESPTATNAIIINNETIGVSVTGIVSGNDFSINDSFLLNGEDVTMVGDGVYSVVDGEGRIDIEYTLDGTTECIGVWLQN